MTIGIDARLWDQGGVGRYIRNLVLNLVQIDEKNEYVLFVRSEDERDVRNQISELKIENLKLKIVHANISWHSFSEQLNFPRIIAKEKVDLMHFPYFNVPIFYKKPYIITIHDLIYHHFVSGQASTLPLWLYGFKMLSYRYTIKTALNRAKKIIAVSQFTKRDILNTLGVKTEKIEVIYEAADDFSARGGSSFGRKLESDKLDFGNYFLYVGNIYPHKNAELLIKAFRILSKEDSKLRLVFVGKEDYFYAKLKKQLKGFEKNGSVIFLNNVSDQKLASLYRSAICLVRPSLMEGFSLPPIEAAANGCLVLASDIPVHREVFGDSIVYFDQYSLDDILSKMKKIMSLSEKDKKSLIEKQLNKIQSYSWNSTAQQTLKVYESSLGL
ncbi:MAG: glycosyltransferase family 4 protein [Candidatus Levybacteria bacterium]|nr:glycosyltransferase family 4 protein [Candidatus Levybacteria bacterium]